MGQLGFDLILKDWIKIIGFATHLGQLIFYPNSNESNPNLVDPTSLPGLLNFIHTKKINK